MSMLEEIISGDAYAPFPSIGETIWGRLTDGQVIRGVVERVWLDLDRVCIDMTAGQGMFRLIPSRGDTWEAL